MQISRLRDFTRSYENYDVIEMPPDFNRGVA